MRYADTLVGMMWTHLAVTTRRATKRTGVRARQFLSLRAQDLQVVLWLLVFALLPRGDAAMAADGGDLAQRIQRGESFLTNLFDPRLQLLPEYRGSSTYWLFHDKLALYLIAADRLNIVAPHREDVITRLLAMQSTDGGWKTDYKQGQPVGLANVETTCLSLLALQAMRE